MEVWHIRGRASDGNQVKSSSMYHIATIPYHVKKEENTRLKNKEKRT